MRVPFFGEIGVLWTPVILRMEYRLIEKLKDETN